MTVCMPPPSSQHQEHSARTGSGWPMAVVLVTVILAAYGNSFRAPFVYDDTLAIPENPTIRRLWPLSEVLLPQVQGGLTVSGRPILNLSFAINYAISGPNVWSYHVFNVLVHAGSALLLFGIVRRTLRRSGQGLSPGLRQCAAASTPLAFTIAALWALHPMLTQAVTYTVQRAESLMGFFYLLTLYAFARGVECHSLDDKSGGGRRRRWFGLSVAACALGMGTKEVTVTAPLLVLLYDRTFVAGRLPGHCGAGSRSMAPWRPPGWCSSRSWPAPAETAAAPSVWASAFRCGRIRSLNSKPSFAIWRSPCGRIRSSSNTAPFG